MAMTTDNILRKYGQHGFGLKMYIIK